MGIRGALEKQGRKREGRDRNRKARGERARFWCLKEVTDEIGGEILTH